MEKEQLKHIVGSCETGKPAVIRFFGSVNSESVQQFNAEFSFLVDCVKPSKIIVMINSEGGSVIYGMSVFSLIQSCPIEVDCIVEGIAASMGSVIWAAGDNLFMHDYSLLMIHNPFNSMCPDDSENTKVTVEAFRSQLETIYRKRFGMTKEQVKDIMDGAEGVDGSWFTAKEAVKAGFLSPENVIKTSKQVRDKVKNQIDGVSNASSLRDIMTAVSAEIDENKLLGEVMAIHNRTDNLTQTEPKVMEKENETPIFDAISAQLGFSKDAQMTAVSARIAELLKAETELASVKAEYDALKIDFKAKEAELTNVNSKLTEAEASLKKYQDAEAAAFEAKIVALVEEAIKAGKIEDSAKADWIEMARGNFDRVQSVLASIHGRDDIAAKIADDPTNKDQIDATLKTVEEQTKEKIKAVLGDFTLKKF